MIRARWLIILGVVAYLAALLVTVPAGLVYDRLAPAQAPVELSAVTGSIWSGGALLSARGRSLGKLRWEARPARLLLGRGEWALTLSEAEDRLEATAGYAVDGVPYASSLRGQVAASRLAPFLPLGGVRLDGTITLDLHDVRLNDGMPVSGAGQALWENAGAGLGNAAALGALRAELVDAEPGIRADLSDGGGPLALSGQARLRPDGGYTLRLAVSARDDAGADLEALLGMLGPPGPDGKRRLSLSGSL